MKRISHLLALVALVSVTTAQTTGKLSGKATGDDGAPLAGANITVGGTGSGTSSGADGTFQILNVPAGTYSVSASYIGYSGQEVTGVLVISGLNTEVNFNLATSSATFFTLTPASRFVGSSTFKLLSLGVKSQP